MCGICGIVDFTAGMAAPGASLRAAGVWRMLDRMQHRGPQGAHVAAAGAGVLGVGRLAIRGESDGQQPIVDAASGVIVACNGEIDNHAELRRWLAGRGREVHHQTDVAVLPGLYLELGEHFLDVLEGVFALAVWDPRDETLILARDRAGERPLYHAADDDGIRFATELAALDSALEETSDVDAAAIAGYLRRGCFVAPATPFAGVRKLAPGEVARFGAACSDRRRYWRFPISDAPKRKPSLAAFDETFRAAVQRQTEVDVDFGVFLSGGLDSSLVAAVARAVRPDYRPPAYTLRFAEASYDEGGFAARVADDLGLTCAPLLVQPEMLPTCLTRLVQLTGEPLADPAWIPTALLAARAAEDVRIAFTGEGGDELFGGYPTYLGATFARHYDRLPAPLRKSLAALVAALPASERKVTLSFLLKRFVAGDGATGLDRHLIWTSPLNAGTLADLGVGDAHAAAAEHRAGESLLDQLQLHDLETTLAEGLLTKSDRGGMSAGVELRSPFLDRAVMEFAAGLPPRERVSGLTTKVFLKRYAMRYLPRDIVRRRKRGLSVPLAAWLRGPLAEWATAKLDAGRLAAIGLRPEAALALLAQHEARRADHARALWTLLVLDEWIAWAAQRRQALPLVG